MYGGREAKSDPMAGSMRHADGMTADPKPLLKMRDVGHERQRFERQSYKPVEQHHAHVVNARLHGTVE